jgi:hypothetical protein
MNKKYTKAVLLRMPRLVPKLIPRVDKLTLASFFHCISDAVKRFVVLVSFSHVLKLDDAQTRPTGLLGEKLANISGIKRIIYLKFSVN